MLRLSLAVIMVMSISSAVLADWELYRRDRSITASFDILSFAPFHNQPSVWIRWHYNTPRNGLGGVKLHFTANCRKHKLYEIAEYPYDTKGDFLKHRKRYDTPKEYQITPDSLNEATYKLLCH